MKIVLHFRSLFQNAIKCLKEVVPGKTVKDVRYNNKQAAFTVSFNYKNISLLAEGQAVFCILNLKSIKKTVINM